MSAPSRDLRFVVTRLGSAWTVEETITGGLGGLFVSLDSGWIEVETRTGHEEQGTSVNVSLPVQQTGDGPTG